MMKRSHRLRRRQPAAARGGERRPSAAPASINGIALHAPGERLDESSLRERAWGELLRQEAVRQGAAAPP